MSSTGAATTDSSAHTLSQVVFIDIPHLYPLSSPITCCYILSAAFQTNGWDWVGIFKMGWSTTKEYQTFVWAKPCLDVEGQELKRHAAFKDYYLPKDGIDFYQFCYIDSTGQVRGASTPFCFKHPVEQSLSSMDDDILVITTQERLEQNVCEKVQLLKVLSQITEENETLNRLLQVEHQEVSSLREQNEQMEIENTHLVKDLEQMKEQVKKLKEQLELKVSENVQLLNVLTRLPVEYEALNKVLPKKLQALASLKERNEQTEKEKTELIKDVEQLKELNENLKQQLNESGHSKEMITHLTKQLKKLRVYNNSEETKMSLHSDGASRKNEWEKLEQAWRKIKQYNEELKGKVNALSEENAMLNPSEIKKRQ